MLADFGKGQTTIEAPKRSLGALLLWCPRMKTANLAIRCALGVLLIWCDERISLIVATHFSQMIR
jgi:hypothetical protein